MSKEINKLMPNLRFPEFMNEGEWKEKKLFELASIGIKTLNQKMINEIILYQSNELPERIEVRIEDETVWLTQQQMATLFMQTKQNISLHINNCFNENELQKKISCQGFLDNCH